MKTLILITHNLKSSTLEAVLADENGVPVLCQNFHPLQIDDFKLAAGEHAQKYIDLAGWTPEYIAAVKKKEEDESAERQAKSDADEAERKAKKDKADKDAFDADVARQVAVLEASKKIVDSKK